MSLMQSVVSDGNGHTDFIVRDKTRSSWQIFSYRSTPVQMGHCGITKVSGFEGKGCKMGSYRDSGRADLTMLLRAPHEAILEVLPGFS